MEKIKFVNNNWPNGPTIGCKFPCNLLDFIEMKEHLKELKELEGEFGQDEL